MKKTTQTTIDATTTLKLRREKMRDLTSKEIEPVVGGVLRTTGCSYCSA